MVNFGKDLEAERLSQWSDKYINYEELKEFISMEIIENEKMSMQEKETSFENFEKKLTDELNRVNYFYNEISENLYKVIEEEQKQKTYSHHYNRLDEIRHYCLLNIIAVIKIIKKRNKQFAKFKDEQDINASDILEQYSFFKSKKLIQIYEKLKEKTIDYDTTRLENIFNKSKNLLTRMQNNEAEFSLDELLGRDVSNSSHKKWSDNEIHDYIQNKLGLSHKLEEITIVEKVNERNNQIIERFGERTENINVSRKTMMIRTFTIISSLYAFLFGLDMMGSSFKALSGKNIGELFTQINNPIAGLIVGILVTVMLQSSSTTTSIIVSMVGADLVNTKQAIPLIMGANIGTSVTNTIVSHGHVHNKEEFQKAFSGATIHDIFNLMCVSVMLPIEIITEQFDSGFLFMSSDAITTSVINLKGLKFKSPLKFIVAPLVKMLISIDKKIIAANAKGCVECDYITNSTSTTSEEISGCWNLDHDECYTTEKWVEKYQEGDVIKSGLFSHLGDTGGGVLSLFISLGILCIALYKIVSTLHRIILQGRGRGKILDVIVNVLTKNGLASILFGMLLTISVQSSSITTSTFTPLVGLSIISLEQMLPLTLGANLGTTCTAFIASLVTESRNAVQIAVCHFMFNLTGVVLFYPIPQIRQLPIAGAKRLGAVVTTYKSFGILYTSYVFVIVPLLLLVISYFFNGDLGYSIVGTFFLGLLGYASILGFKEIEKKARQIKNNADNSNNQIEVIEM